MPSLLSEFDDFPRERNLIGEMLLAYGELEFVLVSSISQALSVDIDTSTRILFRVRGESARLLVADAILRPTFSRHQLEAKWITAFSAANHCKNIRNQYAHCHWQLHEGKLYFINLDEEATDNGEILNVTFFPIDLSLIERQYAYLEYAAAYLYFLDDRLARKLGKELSTPPFPEPKSIPQPPRDNRPSKAAPAQEATNG
jgi:hypothetical protein